MKWFVITAIGLSLCGVIALGVAASQRTRLEGVFRVAGTDVVAPGELLGDDALATGRGFVRGAPLSNALLAPDQDPPSLPGAFKPTLVRYDDAGEPVVYRAQFRSNKYAEFRQLLLQRAIADDQQAVLEYELQIHGARTRNGREHWLTLEPTGRGVDGFSVSADGRFDPSTGRLELDVVERLPDGLPTRYRFAFVIDDDNAFAMPAPD